MRKSLLIFSIILVVSLATWTFFSATDKISSEQAVIDAFNQSNADAMISNISFNGILSNSSMPAEELKEVAKEIAGKLDINMQSVEKEANSSDTYTGYHFSARTTNDDIVKIEIWSEKSETEENSVSYIKLDFYQDYFYDDFGKMREYIEKVLNPHVTTLEVTSSITGTYNGKLDENSIKVIYGKVFRNIDGKKVFSKTQAESTSVFVSDKFHAQPFVFEHKRDNLKLSIRYNEFEDKTYITLSTPRTIE